MGLKSFWILLISVLVFSKALAQNFLNHNVCEGVKTVHLTDPKISRSLIVNYDPKSKKYVFLRCGDSDVDKLKKNVSKGCYIYKSGVESKLCSDEKNYLKISAILKKGVETGFNAAVSGGLSEIRALNQAVAIAREARVNPDCLGISLMRQLALHGYSKELFEMYYEVQIRLLPFSGWAKLMPKDSFKASDETRTSFVLERLDYTLNPTMRKDPMDTKKIKLRGRPYFDASLRTDGLRNLSPVADQKKALCDFFKSSSDSFESQGRGQTDRTVD